MKKMNAKELVPAGTSSNRTTRPALQVPEENGNAMCARATKTRTTAGCGATLVIMTSAASAFQGTGGSPACSGELSARDFMDDCVQRLPYTLFVRKYSMGSNVQMLIITKQQLTNGNILRKCSDPYLCHHVHRCGTQLNFDTMDDHVKQCSGFPIECAYCDECPPRSRSQAHRKDCPKRPTKIRAAVASMVRIDHDFRWNILK